jgi:uncharacterized membrane protein
MASPLSSWDALHPFAIHFPIALLFAAPLFVIAGLAIPKVGRWFSVSALALMLLGTAGAIVAVSTGEAAADALKTTSAAVEKTLELHEEMSEAARTVFAILALVYAAIIFGPVALKKELKPKINILIQSAFLIFYAAGMILLANAAHQGGLLVHQHGVQARVLAGQNSGGGLASWFAEEEGRDEDDSHGQDRAPGHSGAEG